MNIDKYKNQHADSLAEVANLRGLVKQGVEANEEKVLHLLASAS